MLDLERKPHVTPSIFELDELRFADLLVQQALAYEGKPTRRYTDPVHGMDPDEGFDCSGLVTRTLTDVGFSPDVRHANEYFNQWGVPVHFELRRKGDLVFFSNKGRWATHVGIMVDEESFIHARPRFDRVLIEPLREQIITGDSAEQLYIRNPIGFRRAAESNGRWRAIR